jgi:ceramide glucosyltransferase
LAALVVLQGAAVAAAALAVALASRAWLIRRTDAAAPHVPGDWWLFPARDMLSAAVFAGSFLVRRVEWRGSRFRVQVGGGMARD